ncbi:hypothetical protein EKH55_5477 [Sinorhizobium alkalisoli]|nr:hypothetical protein EKH55_5477 [Sinorhizobium alkalisoli]
MYEGRRHCRGRLAASLKRYTIRGAALHFAATADHMPLKTPAL